MKKYQLFFAWILATSTLLLSACATSSYSQKNPKKPPPKSHDCNGPIE